MTWKLLGQYNKGVTATLPSSFRELSILIGNKHNVPGVWDFDTMSITREALTDSSVAIVRGHNEIREVVLYISLTRATLTQAYSDGAEHEGSYIKIYYR